MVVMPWNPTQLNQTTGLRGRKPKTQTSYSPWKGWSLPKICWVEPFLSNQFTGLQLQNIDRLGNFLRLIWIIIITMLWWMNSINEKKQTGKLIPSEQERASIKRKLLKEIFFFFPCFSLFSSLTKMLIICLLIICLHVPPLFFVPKKDFVGMCTWGNFFFVFN